MEQTVVRLLEFSIAILAAFSVALWFALAVWTYRDITRRSENIAMQVMATLVVVLGFIPGIVIYLLLRPRETLDERYQRAVEEEYLAQELGSIPVCPNCERSVRDEFIFCPECGTVLRRSCVSCGRLVDADWNLCAYCGVDLPARALSSRNGKVSEESVSALVTSSDAWEVDLEDYAVTGGGDTGELPADEILEEVETAEGAGSDAATRQQDY